jgi:DNA processing protein
MDTLQTTGPDSSDQARLEAVAASVLLLDASSRAARIFKTLDASAGVEDLARFLGFGDHRLHQAVASARARAREAVTKARELGAHPITSREPGYPAWLREIPDPPIVLWVRGDAEALVQPGVAVVGSRRPAASSVACAERLAQDLARAGLVVTSGLARGVDGAAHSGALSAGGRTVAVLGSGVDVIYPPDHDGLAGRIQSAGCLVSEFPPGMPPLAHHFPLRNRVISGLSRAVVVVEAAERSGSLITARAALEQGRSVCAVPGGVASGCHRGCHALIKDGARLVETVEDVLEEIGWVRTPDRPKDCYKSLSSNSLLDAMAPGTPVSVDELAENTSMPGATLLGQIGLLEVQGRVRRLPGGLFVRVD